MRKIFALQLSRKNLILMSIAIIINSVLFFLSYKLNLPFLLDTVGTYWIAIVLGPTAGVAVALVNSIFVALGFYGFKSFIYFIVTAILALFVGVLFKCDLIKSLMAGLGLIFSCFIINALLSSVMPLIIKEVNMGLYDKMFYEMFRHANLSEYVSLLVSNIINKMTDTLAASTIVTIAYFCTPKKFFD